MSTVSLAEIVNTAREAESNEEKVSILRKNDSRPLRDILALMCDARWTFDLPSTPPPYTESVIHESHGMLYREMRKMPYLVTQMKDGANLNRLKKEAMFIQMLESIDPNDAKLLLRTIAKEPYPDLSPEVINEAFPGGIVEPIAVKRGRGRPKKNESQERSMSKSKSKKFREWVDEDFDAKKDTKRYDKSKSDIQKARKEKRKSRDSY